ncbi:MAG: hypothetical protein EA401_06455 [Planctomycetota bacterium]|nr:MAG: hypothetical protein EA401_06455 [Planctomycetota bacterium]
MFIPQITQKRLLGMVGLPVIFSMILACTGGPDGDDDQPQPSSPVSDSAPSSDPAQQSPEEQSPETEARDESASATAEPAPTAASAGDDEVAAEPAAQDAASASDGDEELAELVRQLDFTTARMRALARAEDSADSATATEYRELAGRYSAYAQELPSVREHFALLAGNQQHRNAAMAEIFQGGALTRKVMAAVIAPDVQVTDDDSEILPVVLELARALEFSDGFQPALQRHASLPPGELRQQVSDHLHRQAETDPPSYAAHIAKHVRTTDPVDLVDLLPMVTIFIQNHDMGDEQFQQDYRGILRQAAEALPEDEQLLRGQLFTAAVELQDQQFSQEIMALLGSGAADMEGLPPGWTLADIGDIQLAGEAQFIDGAFVLHAAGDSFWGNEDDISMIWRKRSGDVSMRARLDSIADVDEWGKGGISLRHSLDADAVHASILASPGDEPGYRFVLGHRDRKGGSTSNSGSHFRPLPAWIELRRSGNEVIALISSDGEEWEEFARQEIDFPDEIYVGPVLNSSIADQRGTMKLTVPLDELF